MSFRFILSKDARGAGGDLGCELRYRFDPSSAVDAVRTTHIAAHRSRSNISRPPCNRPVA